MFTVELYAKIRYAVMIDGLSRREAAKRFGVHRNTITKMLSFSVPPGYRRRERPASKKLGPYLAWIDAILEGDGADLARRTRQCRAHPRLQIVLLLHTEIACAPAHIEASNAFDPALLEELAPAADRVVVKEQRMGDLLTAPPFVQKHQGIRTPCHPARRRPVARQRRKRHAIFFAEEARPNHARNRIRPIRNRKKFLPALQ